MSYSTFKRQFQQVCKFNRVFMATRLDTTTNAIPDELYNFRVSLIQEEFEELQHAIRTHDTIEVIDALADLLYVSYGMLDVITTPSEIDEVLRQFNSDVTSLRTNQLSMIDDIGLEIYKLSLHVYTHPVTQANLIYLIKLLYSACPIQVNLDLAFELVHENNMTKACMTRDDAEKSAQVLVTSGKCVKCNVIENDNYFVIVNAFTGKVCKPYHYKAVDLSVFNDINLFD